MRIAIFRSTTTLVNISKYNVQEIGLAKALFEKGHTVHIYARFVDIKKEVVYEKNSSNEIVLIPMEGIIFYRQVAYYTGLMKKIFSRNYDVIQLHEDSQLMNPLVAYKAKRRNIKVVLYQGMYLNYSGVGYIYQSILDFLFKKMLKRSVDVVLAKTTSAQQYLIDKGYRDPVLMPVGLDLLPTQEKYAGLKDLEQFKNKFDHVILYVGVLEPRRDVMFFLKVFKALVQEGLNIGFVIVGDGVDLKKIETGVKDLKLEGNVLIKTSVSNTCIGHYYNISSLLVLPTRYEIFGMVVMEALLQGTPVLSSNTAGPKDILQHDYLGKAIKFDEELWRKNVKYYLTEQSDNLEKRRRDFIIQNYTWDKITDIYLKKLNNII